MQNKFWILAFIFFISLPANSSVMEGGVTKTGATSSVIDRHTSEPVSGAKISLPQLKFSTTSDADGAFDLNQKINGQTVLSVEKDGYRPYSITIDEKVAAGPVILSVEKSNVHDIVVESEMIHIGDDSFSENSANSGEFQLTSSGLYYTKNFKMPSDSPNRSNFLVIGSIIGIDTLMARQMGQNKIITAYANPPEIYFNGSKIAEIHLNGDGQKIKLPNKLVKPDAMNEITIKAGRNMAQTEHADYDDIEFANLSIQSEE